MLFAPLIVLDAATNAHLSAYILLIHCLNGNANQPVFETGKSLDERDTAARR